jgi:pyruvate/2-oxoglutarate dehydrogenase complex dihydrolipoamide dehydrogenase (E3) component
LNLKEQGERVDMKAVRGRKRHMVDGLQETHCQIFEDSKVEVIWGPGIFVGEKSISITGTDGNRVVTADKIVISTGSRTQIPFISGLKKAILSATSKS